MNNLKFHISRNSIFETSLGLHFWGRTGDGKLILAEPILFKVQEDLSATVGMYRPPELPMTIEQAQQLMDELWHVGLRPSEGTGSAGSLAATQKHLSDMRSIVEKTLNVALK